MKFAKVITILLWVILAISFYLIVSLIANLNTNISDTNMLKWISANLNWSFVLLGIATVAALAMEFINILSDKKTARKFLIGLGLLGTVIFVSYLLSDTQMPQFRGAEKFIENGTATPAKLVWIGTGLITSYILFGITVLAMVWSAISNFFK